MVTETGHLLIAVIRSMWLQKPDTVKLQLSGLWGHRNRTLFNCSYQVYMVTETGHCLITVIISIWSQKQDTF